MIAVSAPAVVDCTVLVGAVTVVVSLTTSYEKTTLS